MPLTRASLGWGKDKNTCIKTAHFGVRESFCDHYTYKTSVCITKSDDVKQSFN